MPTPIVNSPLPLIVPASTAGPRELRAPAGFAETLKQVGGSGHDTAGKGTRSETTKSAAPQEQAHPEVANRREDERDELPADDSLAAGNEAGPPAEAAEETLGEVAADTVDISAAAVQALPAKQSDVGELKTTVGEPQSTTAEVETAPARTDAGGRPSPGTQLEPEIPADSVVEKAPATGATPADSEIESAASGHPQANTPTGEPKNQVEDAAERVTPRPLEAAVVAGAVTNANQRDSFKEATLGDTATAALAQPRGESDPADDGLGGGNAKQPTSGEVATRTEQIDLESGDPTPEVDAKPEGDTNRGESREKTSPGSQNFQSLLERSTASAARRIEQAEPSQQEAPRVDPARFVTRVARAFEAAEQRGGTIQLRLSPPELGAMKIELTMQQGGLTARLETETSVAKNVLLDNLPALRERLAAQDIRVDKFEVDVRQQGSGSQPDWQAQQESRDAGHRTWQRPGRTPQPLNGDAAAPTARQTHARTDHDGQFSAVA